MKTAIAILVVLALTAFSGCWFAGTKVSSQGGIAPKDEGFSITVPTPDTMKQGEDKTFTILLNRGAYFKRDVALDIATEGISVSPTNFIIKASDKPDVEIRIAVPREAALGEYDVSVKGTPESGEPTSTEFTVKVVAQ